MRELCPLMVVHRVTLLALETTVSRLVFSSRLITRPKQTLSRLTSIRHKSFLATMNQGIQIVPLPVNKDNYSYLLIDRRSGSTACVDPFNPNAILHYVAKHNLNLLYCLTTHYHYDHAGGNSELRKKVGDKVLFIGSAYEDTSEVTERKKDGDVFSIGELKCTALHAKCHTTGHLMYYIEDTSSTSSSPCLITGDTLFVGGCGRFFEGDGYDMIKIVEKLNGLDPKTRIYPGHEYSINNLQFALSLEPANQEIQKALDRSILLLKQGQFPIGTTLEEERQYNPFLRCHILKDVLGFPNEVTCMEECRKLKNSFSPKPHLSLFPDMWKK